MVRRTPRSLSVWKIGLSTPADIECSQAKL
ncbi:MAG: hypothetical protein ACJAQ9_002215, partial [Ilumatobacter sp.]